jgi:hypothetical protein
MTHVKLAAAAIVAFLAFGPGLAQARTHHHRHHYHHHHYRHHHHHVRLYPLPYKISYLHNYGPGPVPGTFSYYDGPSTVHCAQSAAAYLGQDRHRYACN